MTQMTDRGTEYPDAYARAMLLIGWLAANHTHRNLWGELVRQPECWGCEQIGQLMAWNENHDV